MSQPKQARSHATRGRLVDAAATCLIDLGISGASTSAVASRAEVSQGALFKHFTSKPLLLAACVERILGGFFDAFRLDVAARLAAAPYSPEARLKAAVGALWQIFRRAEMHAVFEVYLAARTDTTLAAALTPILERHRSKILTEAARLFPEFATPASAACFETAVDAVVYAMQGVIVGVFSPDAAAEAQHLAFFERLAQHELALAATRAVC